MKKTTSILAFSLVFRSATCQTAVTAWRKYVPGFNGKTITAYRLK